MLKPLQLELPFPEDSVAANAAPLSSPPPPPPPTTSTPDSPPVPHRHEIPRPNPLLYNYLPSTPHHDSLQKPKHRPDNPDNPGNEYTSLPIDTFRRRDIVFSGNTKLVVIELNGSQRDLFGRLCRFLFADNKFRILYYQSALIACSLAGSASRYRFDANCSHFELPEPEEAIEKLSPFNPFAYPLSTSSAELVDTIHLIASDWKSQRIKTESEWLERINGFDSTLLPPEEEETTTDREMRTAAKKS